MSAQHFKKERIVISLTATNNKNLRWCTIGMQYDAGTLWLVSASTTGLGFKGLIDVSSLGCHQLWHRKMTIINEGRGSLPRGLTLVPYGMWEYLRIVIIQ